MQRKQKVAQHEAGNISAGQEADGTDGQHTRLWCNMCEGMQTHVCPTNYTVECIGEGAGGGGRGGQQTGRQVPRFPAVLQARRPLEKHTDCNCHSGKKQQDSTTLCNCF